MQHDIADGLTVRMLLARGGALACWPTPAGTNGVSAGTRGWLILAARRAVITQRLGRAGETTLGLPGGSVSILRLDGDEDLRLPPVPHGVVPIFVCDASLPAIFEGDAAHTFREVIGLASDNLVAVAGYLADGLRTPGPETPLPHDGLLKSFIACVNAGSPPSDLPHRAAAPGRIHMTRRKLDELERFVGDNIDQPIDVLDLSRVAEMSVGHLCRVMKRDTGFTPYQFVLRMRIDRARAHLAQRDVPLVEVALACGFANQAHFNAAFKKMTGLTPGQFRRIATGRAGAHDLQRACHTAFPGAAATDAASGHSPEA